MTAIAALSAADLVRLYQRRELSPVETARDILARIEANRAVNAFLPLDAARVLDAARASEARWSKAEPLGAIDGVPATVKDNIWLKDWPTRKGSKTADLTPAPADAPAVARLREQGAVFIGKTTMPEHGWIGACHSPLTGITRNPWNPEYTPGGSTGGGAVAALLGLGVFHLGTDGAGSLRIPAAFTGVVGMKPSYGLVPVYPPSPLSVLSHHGPIARSVTDLAFMLSIIGAPDARDMAAWDSPAQDFASGLDDGVRGLRIAWSPRLGFVKQLDPQVEAAAARAAYVLQQHGAQVEEADPDLGRAVDIIRVLWFSVAAAIVDGVPQPQRALMDEGLLQIAEQGRRYSPAEYLAAYNARFDLHNAMRAFHVRYDLLLTPTMPITAFAVGYNGPPDGRFGDDWLAWSPYTYPFNLTQQPAISLPCGLSAQRLPIGLQIVGALRHDRQVLQAARAVEMAMPFPVLPPAKQK